ncbi:MAG TPA: ubiquinol-cytochrome C chaperone [Alphaproteobacteria bacterium]|nr:ubiquinol-cytochrome C chaperone [Alphaproteobacteria bacterium]HAJ45923.1 ubiquinol-cytochrome C chaperone [Alphaproteobacteria bacterium]
MTFFRFFREAPERTAGMALFQTLAFQSRRPEFFVAGQVPDTFDGRFDLLVLNASIVFRRVKACGPRGAKVAQVAFDLLFQDFDQALREMGVGDLTVPKRIKDMGEAFYGRAVAYDKALEAADVAALAGALQRNLYGGHEAGGMQTVARYAQRLYDSLKEQADDDLCAGRVQFPELATVDIAAEVAP